MSSASTPGQKEKTELEKKREEVNQKIKEDVMTGVESDLPYKTKILQRYERRLANIKKYADKPERVVNIVGMGSNANALPDTGENWGINYAFMYGKMDKIFFADRWDVYVKESRDERVKKRLEDVIQSREVDFIPIHPIKLLDFKTKRPLDCIKPYPIKEAFQLMPGIGFCSTMSWTIAYAILEGEINDNQPIDRIRLYGFEVWSGSNLNEYYWERPDLDAWLNYALGKGIQVEIPWYVLRTIGNRSNIYGFQKPIH